MWREWLEAFWDGGSTLVLGFFGVPDLAHLDIAGREMLVVSFADANFKTNATLLDVIELRTSSLRHWVVTLPPGHHYVSLSIRENEDLHLHLVRDEDISSSELRLLLTELSATASGSGFFRIAAVAARADRDRFTLDQIGRSGDRLVWAVRQQRRVERRANSLWIMQVSPSHRIWPQKESRITIEALETPRLRKRDVPKVPFALLDHWSREVPLPVAVRIRVPSLGEEFEGAVGRMAVVHIMHQRRHLSHWMSDKRKSGDPIIDPVTFDDIRTAIDDQDEMPDAIESSQSIAMFPLSQVLSAASGSEFDGIFVHQVQNAGRVGATEIEFFGATLGDDIGLVSNWASEGDLTIRPSDYGGTSKARLLRVEVDGLTPRPIEDDDPILDEILTRAADIENPNSAMAEPAQANLGTGLNERQTAFLARLMSLIAGETLALSMETHTRWEDLDPLITTAFAAVVAGPAAENVVLRLGTYAGFRSDPALASFLARRPELISDVPADVLATRHDASDHLARRVAAVRGTPDVVAKILDLTLQIQAWRALAEIGLAKQLADARITLGGTSDDIRIARRTASALRNADDVDRAAASQGDRGNLDAAKTLRRYLINHNQGNWTPLNEATALAKLVEEVRALQGRWINASVVTAPFPKPETLVVERRNPVELRTAIEAQIDRGKKLMPGSAQGQLETVERSYRDFIELDEPDRYVLIHFLNQISTLIEQPAEDQRIDALITVLEEWAGLSGFLDGIEPRLNRDSISHASRHLDVLTLYVNRTYPSVPRRSGRTQLDLSRAALGERIREKFQAATSNARTQSDAIHVVVQFADILVFHQAYRAISEVLPSLASIDSASADVQSLHDGLIRWPRGAAQTWETATRIVQTHLPSGAKRLDQLIAAPDLSESQQIG